MTWLPLIPAVAGALLILAAIIGASRRARCEDRQSDLDLKLVHWADVKEPDDVC